MPLAIRREIEHHRSAALRRPGILVAGRRTSRLDVQVVSDAIEPKHFHSNAAADSAENESRHYGLANICISAKVSRRVFGRDFSV